MFNIFNKKKLIVTHNGGFHADDVFACAVLSILEKNRVKIARTRDPRINEKADYVVDTGGIYDEDLNRFDHHQKDGAGARENGIQYASAGLVWKKFGRILSGNEETAQKVDQKLIQAIDANDSGMNIADYIYPDVFYFRASDLIGSLNATSLENQNDIMPRFKKAVALAKDILLRQIKVESDRVEINKIIKTAYENSVDKRIIILDRSFRRVELMEGLYKFPEPLFVVYPDSDGRGWRSTAVLADMKSFNYRKKFPDSWAGLHGEKLQEVSGVSDAEFCHRNLFTVSVKSREGAIKLSQLALKS